MAEGYATRIASSVVRRAPRQPSSLIGALGEGLETAGAVGVRIARDDARAQEQVAESEARIAEIEKRRAQSAAIATGAGALADVQLATDQQVAEARTKTAPGAPGHKEAVTALVDKQADDFMASLPDDPEVRQRFSPLVRQWRARTIGEESAWEIGERAKFQGTSIGKLQDAQLAAQQTTPDPAKFDADETGFRSLVEAMDVPGSAKASIIEKYESSHAQAFLDGLLNTGQTAAAKAVLASGQFDARLGAGKDAYLGRVETAEALAAKQAEAAKAEALDGALDNLKAIKIRIDKGDDVPQSEINAALAAAQGAGADKATLTEYAYLGQDAELKKDALGRPSAVLAAQRDALLEKRRQGALSGAEARQLDVVEKELDARDEKAGDDIGGLWRQGAPGRLEAVNKLALLPPERRYAAASKFSVKAFVVASLPERQRALAIQGAELRTARPDDFVPPAVPGRSSKWVVDQTLRTTLGVGVTRALAGQFDEVRETALDLLAAGQNDGAGNRWNAAAFKKAVQVVMGGSARPDGSWQGGIGTVRGRTIELPARWNASEFDQRFSRFDFAAAGARYADGKPAAKADVLANYQPMVDSEGDDGTVYYRLEDARGRALVRADGSTYLMAVAPSPTSPRR